MTGRAALAGGGVELNLPSGARLLGFEVFMLRVRVARKHSSTPLSDPWAGRREGGIAGLDDVRRSPFRRLLLKLGVYATAPLVTCPDHRLNVGIPPSSSVDATYITDGSGRKPILLVSSTVAFC